MAMIDDLIDLAHAEGLVHSTAREPDGCDAYHLLVLPRRLTVWVRPDGRFSRAAADGEPLTLGLVMKSLVAAIRDGGAGHRERAAFAAGIRGSR